MFFLKIDLSGYFMSIDRKKVSEKFTNLIVNKYNGKHKELLLYLTPLIFENNPALNCRYKCNEKMREKVSYPYGYQKPSKQVIIRVYQKAKEIKYTDKDNLLSKTNSQIGSLKNYNCKRLISNYVKVLPKEVQKILRFDDIEYKFKIKNTKTI